MDENVAIVARELGVTHQQAQEMLLSDDRDVQENLRSLIRSAPPLTHSQADLECREWIRKALSAWDTLEDNPCRFPEALN